MPRLIGQEAGLHVPGVYQALLALERERNERDDRRVARTMAEHGHFFRRCRLFAERLEAGEAVTVARSTVESALWERDRPPRPVRLPFDREVRLVRVTPDDRIAPAAAEDAH